MKRVSGYGGLFSRAKNPSRLQKWYKKHLSMELASSGGFVFEWMKPDGTRIGHTVWAPFERRSKYFAPSKKEFMVNYKVENLRSLLSKLRKEGVRVVGKVEEYSYGKFGWIMDPDGTKIELWEPNDAEFRKINKLDRRENARGRKRR